MAIVSFKTLKWIVIVALFQLLMVVIVWRGQPFEDKIPVEIRNIPSPQETLKIQQSTKEEVRVNVVPSSIVRENTVVPLQKPMDNMMERASRLLLEREQALEQRQKGLEMQRNNQPRLTKPIDFGKAKYKYEPTPRTVERSYPNEPNYAPPLFNEWIHKGASLPTFGDEERRKKSEKLRGRAVIYEGSEEAEFLDANELINIYAGNYEMSVKQRQQEELKLIDTVLGFTKDQNIEIWFSHSILLGAYNTKEFLANDTGAHVGIGTEAHLKLIERVSLMEGITPNEAWGSKDVQMIMRVGHESHIIPYKLVNTKNGVFVDFLLFFPTNSLEGKWWSLQWPDCHVCRINLSNAYTLARSDIFPIKMIEFEGRKVPAPNDPETYLKAWFKDLSKTPLYLQSS